MQPEEPVHHHHHHKHHEHKHNHYHIQAFEEQEREVDLNEYHEYKEILNHNKHFAALMVAQDPNYFKNLAVGQHPSYLLVGCSDSRVPPEQLVQEVPGEIFTVRNIANQVLPADFNVQAVVQYAVEHLKVHHIIVMGHSGCGGIVAAYERTTQGGMLDLWLANIRKIMFEHHKHLDKLKDEDAKIDFLVKQNVKDQVHNLWQNSFIQKALQEGEGTQDYLQMYIFKAIWIHGWVFHVNSGYIEDIMLEKEIPHSIKDIYGLNFQKE